MNPDGQTYFYTTDIIPEADRQRYLESLREEEERVREKIREREAFNEAAPETLFNETLQEELARLKEERDNKARERAEDRHQGLSDPMG